MDMHRIYRVTDRSPSEILEAVGIPEAKFTQGVYKKSSVFVAGSGLYQIFENWLSHYVNQVYACDPSLDLDANDWSVKIDKDNRGGKYSATYINKPDMYDPIQTFQQERLKAASKPNKEIITSSIPPINIEVGIDLGIDHIGAGHYIKDVEDLLRYVQEIARVLNPGGVYIISPISNREELWDQVISISKRLPLYFEKKKIGNFTNLEISKHPEEG